MASTTGYDFLNPLNNLFIDGSGLPALEETYNRFIETPAVFSDVVYQKKKLVMEQLFSSELASLGSYLANLARPDRATADLPETSLTAALVEVPACPFITLISGN